MRQRISLFLLAAALLLVAGLPAGAVPTRAEPTASLDVVSVQQVSPRLHEYVVHSEALTAEAVVRVQLPSGYEQDPDREWPMALLLHGRSENARTWSERTDLEQFDGMVVVMPDGGRVGWYTDWYDDDPCCGPARQRWESFHIGEVLPWAAEAFRLADRRSQRFVAGDSMGGFGAMSYAARHPDLFAGVAELSGFVDLMLLESSGVVGVDGQSYQVAGVPPGSVFGPRHTHELRWRARNPVDLADNLRHTDLVLRHGNGVNEQPGGSPDAGEAAIRLTGVSLHDRLTALEIDHRWDDYGNGVHTWPYWERGLQITWPRWLAIAAADAPDPEAFSYRSGDPSWSVYGWDVALDRQAAEFAHLDVTSPRELVLTGSGRATVTTPPSFLPQRRYEVTTAGQTRSVRADDDGRLTFPVDLGPSHVHDQYSPAARAAQLLQGDQYMTSVAVTIAAAPATGRAGVA